ncbi:SIMPL domain-containing protein [Nocardioides sp. C4-1]|uniref:SIMPL domain-containing protein n=1 Tax=Nocardioides sp. C4-1 TaxID=3151851 RepID=UPI003267BA0D
MLSTRTVTTTGHGAVAVPRDAANVNVSVSHAGATLAEALAGAESARGLVVEVAREHVDPAAVASQGLSTWARQDHEGRVAGFEARHALRLRCGGLDVAATVLQALADRVGDRLAIDNVELTTSPTPDHLATARERAFTHAREKAEHLAGLAGAALGAVVSVAEAGVGGPRPVARMELAAKADVDFEGGSDDVGAGLTVTWELG